MAQNTILLESGTNELEIVEFFIDELEPNGTTYRGHYGVNVAKVLEIIREPDVIEVPNTPHPSVLGAFNLRNKIIPLIDLAIWLDKSRADDGAAKVIVSEFNRTVTAFLVSGVNRIHRLSWEAVEPPSAHVATYSSGSITGVVRMGDHIIFLLDMEKIVGELNPALVMRVDKSIVADQSPLDVSLKALVVDDSTSIRQMIARLLEQAGFVVERSINGREAWERLLAYKAEAEAQGRPLTDFVELVVSDIEMPVMDGHNLTKRIKSEPVLKDLPVILFSSLITDGLRHKGEAVGADDQVSKPDISTLTERAKALIKERRSGA